MHAALDQVHLWFARDADCTPALLQEYRATLLSPEELIRADRFYFEEHRNQFVLTRALVRTVLSKYAPHIAPHAWCFDKGEYGRPFITNAGAPALEFNLSHTAGLVVLALTGAQEIGVDVENFLQRTAPLDVAGHCFSAPEIAALHALPAEAQQERFFHYWTLKESYIKAIGKGLSLPLHRFAMEIEEAAAVEIRVLDAPEDAEGELAESTEAATVADLWQADPRQGWRFFLLEAWPGYLTALCLRPQHGRLPTLQAQVCLPLAWQQPHNCVVLRRSSQDDK